MNEFQTLLLAHTPELIRYTCGLTGSLESAEAMTEECLEEAMNKHEDWDNQKKIKLWLLTIVHGVYIKWLKDKKKPVQNSISKEDKKALADYSDFNPELLQNLQLSLQLLPSEQREVLLLVCLEGMDYKEVGVITGAKLTTVMSRLHRARTQLGTFVFPQDIDKVESI